MAEVDVSLRVLPVEASFPDGYLRTEPGGARPLQVGQGVEYSERRELVVNGLPAVRARFRTGGPTPNWGVEYVVRKDDRVLDVYASQPSPAVEAELDRVLQTLEW